MGASPVFMDQNHTQRHKGNSDRPDDNAETQDWISVHRHRHDDETENPWSCIFLSFFREGPKPTYRELNWRKSPDANWGF